MQTAGIDQIGRLESMEDFRKVAGIGPRGEERIHGPERFRETVRPPLFAARRMERPAPLLDIPFDFQLLRIAGVHVKEHLTIRLLKIVKGETRACAAVALHD